MFERFRETVRQAKIKNRLEQQEKHLSEVRNAYEQGYSDAKISRLEKEREDLDNDAWAYQRRYEEKHQDSSPFGRRIAFGKYVESD